MSGYQPGDPRPGPEETDKVPQMSWRANEYPPGEWIEICDLVLKRGMYDDGTFYLTGRPNGAFAVRYVVKPFSRREFRFRRIPAHLDGLMYKLGYWQNLVDCGDSKHRSNLRDP